MVYHVSVAMEYCSKGDLYNYIKQVLHCPLSETQARQFFHQTCLGVEFLHSMCIAHLDIKPENLLLDENFNVRIGGTCKQETSSTLCRDYIFLLDTIRLKYSLRYNIREPKHILSGIKY